MTISWPGDVDTLPTADDVRGKPMDGPDTDQAEVYGKLAAIALALEGMPWDKVPFTPALKGATTDPDIGSDGSHAASIMHNGTVVFAQARWEFGSTGATNGSGVYSIDGTTIPDGFAPNTDVHDLQGFWVATRADEGFGDNAAWHGTVIWNPGTSPAMLMLLPAGVRRRHTGTAVVPAGSNTISVAHGLSAPPTDVFVSPRGLPSVAAASGISAGSDDTSYDDAHFTAWAVKQDGTNPGGFGAKVGWEAEVAHPVAFVGDSAPFPFAGGDVLKLYAWWRRALS